MPNLHELVLTSILYPVFLETILIFQIAQYLFQIFVFGGSIHPISHFFYIAQNPEP